MVVFLTYRGLLYCPLFCDYSYTWEDLFEWPLGCVASGSVIFPRAPFG